MEFKDRIFDSSAFSAIFNRVPYSTFIRHRLSNKVRLLYNDNNGNLKINSETRLKKNLYDIIRDMYNGRIKHYGLLFNELPYSYHEDMVHVVKLSVTSEEKKDDDETSGGISSGIYETYPRTFYCDNEKCGNFIYVGKDSDFELFNPKKCNKCNGQYNQFQFVGFCEECGAIIPCKQGCREHHLEDMRLIMGDKDDLTTWKLKCNLCDSDPIDFVPMCYHKDYAGNSKLKNFKPPKRTFPLNMNDGSVFKSVVKIVIDIPEAFGNYDPCTEPNQDYILFGLYLHKFDNYYKKANFNRVNSSLSTYFKFLDVDEEEMEDNEILEFNKGQDINKIIENLQDNYSLSDIRDINDYLILSNFFDENANKDLPILSYNDYFMHINKFEDNLDLNSFEDYNDYNSFKNKYNIFNINYIPDIHLIAASIGKINGLNKFYEEDFVPHFEPHWKNKSEMKIKIITYPFQTEGLMIDLDKIEIVNWLIDNKKLIINDKIITEKIDSYEEAKEILFNLDVANENSTYYEVKKLLHTFAHILISRSSLYTGLDVNSCSEIIFPKSGAFVIYSTSTVNIGGFKFVFENSLKDWFDKVELDVNECIFDPTCIQEKGACFSCLHLPEYVCTEFNECLDRDVFIGEYRYDIGFWKDI